MRRIFFTLSIFFISILTKTCAQKIATLEVDVSKNSNGLAVPTSVELDKITFSSDSSLVLVEVAGNKRTPVPFQISEGVVRTLNWIVAPSAPNMKKRVYELQKGTPQKFDEITATSKEGSLTIHSGNQNLLQYWYKTVYPPTALILLLKEVLLYILCGRCMARLLPAYKLPIIITTMEFGILGHMFCLKAIR